MTDERDMMAGEEPELGADTPEADALGEENSPEAEDIASPPEGEKDDTGAAEEIDYEALVREDLMALAADFSEMRGAESITELKNPLRYAALRDLGLTPREAYLATGGRGSLPDGRRHLFSAVPRSAGAPACGMSRSELERARELFPTLGDKELTGLYKRVAAGS